MDYAAGTDRIDQLLDLRVSWDRLESAVKELDGITEDQRAGLWLYAYLAQRRRRPQPGRVREMMRR